MAAKTCPVANVIKDIYGAGWDDDDSARLIKLGGSDTEIVCDDVSWYIMSRKIELARFELSAPDFAACELKYEKMFSRLAGMKYSAAYIVIMDSALQKKYLHEQFTRLIDLLAEMEQIISTRIATLARANAQINISLPDIFLLSNVDKIILYRPDLIAGVINKIIDYANGFQINAILTSPAGAKIPSVEQFKPPGIDLHASIPLSPRTHTADEYIIFMKKILEHECVIADYIRDIEKYHCIIINHMNKIYEWCARGMSGLIKN